jgi:choline-sulfatase
MKKFLSSLLIFILLIFGSQTPNVSSQAAPAARPNVLFIAVDDLKPALGAYGDKLARTPNIDRLAASGTVFHNAHAQWPVCGPSRASLMTSLRPESTGVMDLKTNMRAKDPNILSLPQYLKQQGYATTGVGKIYDPRCVDDRKLQDAPSWTIPYADLPYHQVRFENAKKVVLAPNVADTDLLDGQIAKRGVELLRQLSKDGKPFFLGVGFKKPHLPFIAPKRYWDLYQRDQFSPAAYRGGITNDSGYAMHDSPEFRGYEGVPKSGPIPEDLQRESLHGYYACASYVDAQVGLLMKELETLGLLKNTIIVLWGDHGFHLGDHGMWGKHSTLEQATRVPLIIRAPNGKQAAQTKAPVELADMFPTLCELAGLAVPKQLQGRSLAPLLQGKQTSVREGAITVFRARGAVGYSYRTSRYRYTEWMGKFGKPVARELYDYETDPLEQTNLVSDAKQSALVEKLAQQLRADCTGCERLKGTATR